MKPKNTEDISETEPSVKRGRNIQSQAPIFGRRRIRTVLHAGSAVRKLKEVVLLGRMLVV
jgi:hypothetical protein